MEGESIFCIACKLISKYYSYLCVSCINFSFTPAVPKCENAVNVGFVVDSSVSNRDYEIQKAFIERLVDVYPISEEGNKAGVVVYNSDAEMSIPLNSKVTHEMFKKKVRTMPHTRDQPSNIVNALGVTRKRLIPNMHKDLSKILIVLTGNEDQVPFESSKAASILQALRASNVSIILVSFGKTEANENMKSIADANSNVFHATDVKKMIEAEFIAPLARQICRLGKAW